MPPCLLQNFCGAQSKSQSLNGGGLQIKSSFAKLMEWSLNNKAVLAGNTPSLAAAALQLVARAHQVTKQAASVAEISSVIVVLFPFIVVHT